MSMSDPLPMSPEMMSEDILNVTSSLESAAGHLPYESPTGQPTSPSGLGRALANRSRSQGQPQENPTLDIFGPSSEESSPSVDLQQFLANRLSALLDASGTPEYVLTWKNWDMPSGPPICALRGRGRKPKDGLCVEIRQSGEPSSSAPHTSDNGYFGWPTPMAGSPATNGNNEAGNNDSSRKTVELAGWGTPTANDDTSAGRKHKNGRLKTQVPFLAGCSTPQAHDGNGGKGPRKGSTATGQLPDGSKAQMDLSALVKIVLHGPTSTSSPAPTANRGVLNPAFSAWLMAFPSDWLMAAPEKISRGRKSSEESATP